MKIIDISSELLKAQVYPGDPEPRIQKMYQIENDDEFNLSALYTGLHNGTHVDAPSHIVENGANILDVPLEKFIGPVEILTLPEGPITGAMVEKIFPKTVRRLILRTADDSEFFAGASEDAAALNYDLLGYDKISIGGKDEVLFHQAFLSKGTVLLEGLDLSSVTHDGEYFLMAQPLKIEGVEASLTRAVLIEDSIEWKAPLI